MKKYFSLALWLFALPMWADNFGSIDAARNLGSDHIYFGASLGKGWLDTFDPFTNVNGEMAYSGFVGLDHPLDSHWGAGGELVVDSTASNVNMDFLGLINVSEYVRSNDVGLYARLRYKFDSGFNVFAKGGAAYVWQMMSSATYSEVVPAFGLGWGYHFDLSQDRSLDLFAQWTHLQFGSQVTSVDMAQIGLAYGLPL